jgi:hypothetical protein
MKLVARAVPAFALDAINFGEASEAAGERTTS